MAHKYDPHKHHRRSIRLKGYDYSSAGAYFVTICTRHMACRFGRIENDIMILNDAGKMIDHQWLALTRRFTHMEFGEFITMPNHFHAILILLPPDDPHVRAPLVGAQQSGQAQGPPLQNAPVRAPLVGAPSLGDIIGAFKSITTNAYSDGVINLGWPPFDRKLWHRNYYEHIIRNENDFLKISAYIESNPARWERDAYFI